MRKREKTSRIGPWRADLDGFLKFARVAKIFEKNIGTGVQIFTPSPGVRGLMEMIIVLALGVVRS